MAVEPGTDIRRFWDFRPASNEVAELHITGDIMDDEDVWIYEWLGIDVPYASPNKFRQALSEHAGKDLIVWIDSYGGSVWAGAGIYNALKEHDGKVTVKIDGKAMSAGSLIAMAGDEIYISPVGMLMIHNPWTQGVGEAKDFRHVADVLDEVKESIINAYTKQSGLTRAEISRLMDDETYMSAKKALELGFVDGILYEDDEPGPEPAPGPAMFSRLAIQNIAAASMRRFFDVAAEVRSDSDLVLQLELLKLKEVWEDEEHIDS